MALWETVVYFANVQSNDFPGSRDQVSSKLYEKYTGSDSDEDMDVNASSVRIVRLVKEEQEPLV